MKARFNSVRQFCLTTALAIPVLLLSHTLSWGTVVTITGNPGPGSVGLNVPYNISVQVAGNPGNAANAYLFNSINGGNLAFKGTFAFTGLGPTAIHTWNVANQSYPVSVTWSAWGDDTTGASDGPTSVGAYTTP